MGLRTLYELCMVRLGDSNFLFFPHQDYEGLSLEGFVSLQSKNLNKKEQLPLDFIIYVNQNTK